MSNTNINNEQYCSCERRNQLMYRTLLYLYRAFSHALAFKMLPMWARYIALQSFNTQYFPFQIAFEHPNLRSGTLAHGHSLVFAPWATWRLLPVNCLFIRTFDTLSKNVMKVYKYKLHFSNNTHRAFVLCFGITLPVFGYLSFGYTFHMGTFV